MDFNEIPVSYLISKDYATKRRNEINPTKAANQVKAADIENGDTIYLTAADNQGNMISLIQSNYRGMGSGMVPPKLGFMLQDRGKKWSTQKITRIAKNGFHWNSKSNGGLQSYN